MSVPDRGKHQCRGLEAATYPAYLRKLKEASVAGAGTAEGSIVIQFEKRGNQG